VRDVPRLHIVTNDEVLARPDFMESAADLLQTSNDGIALHIRGHATAAAALFEMTRALVDVCPSASRSARILVNDRVDVALSAGAHGVQLGARSLPVAGVRSWMDDLDAADSGERRLLGFSAHDVEAAARASEEGADFVVAGSIWESGTHPGALPAGPDLIQAIHDRVRRPILAIGGVRPERVAAAVLAGAHGVAALGYVWDRVGSRSAVQSSRELLAALDDVDPNMDRD
jgi:thiazole tautomerase (transcriptional regulator TenI)